MNDRTKEWAACTEAARAAFDRDDRGAFSLDVARLVLLVGAIDGSHGPGIVSALGSGFWMGVLHPVREPPPGSRRDTIGLCNEHEMTALRSHEANTEESNR